MRSTVSVFDSLTWKNPEIKYETPPSNSLTKKQYFMAPKQLVKWDEFSFETLQSIAHGRLIQTAKTTDSLLAVQPVLRPDECAVTAEPETQHILTKWNHSIVQTGLTAVEETFPICKWNPRATKAHRARERVKNTPDQGSSSPLDSPTVSTTGSGSIRMRKRRKLEPDSGATAPCQVHGSSCLASQVERLPKDYKASTKWKSADVLEAYLKPDGTWRESATKARVVWPIRQAYTYCVQYECRYGCILTTDEAFIFRIKPRCPSQEYPGGTLYSALTKDGLMEYVTVPWDVGEDGCSLSFNLALWFVHILAASQYKTDWVYDPLDSEKLSKVECAEFPVPVTPKSQIRSSHPPVAESDSQQASRKRRRREPHDSYTLSFNENDSPTLFSSSFRSVDRSFQTDDCDGNDGEDQQKASSSTLVAAVNDGEVHESDAVSDDEEDGIGGKRSKRLRRRK